MDLIELADSGSSSSVPSSPSRSPLEKIAVRDSNAVPFMRSDHATASNFWNASTGIAKITLNARAVQRLQLKTDTAKPGATGTEVLLPYASLLYDANGKTWVYTNPEERVYQRQAVTVAKVEAGIVTATAGPPAGTAIVTVGAAELFGAEFDTAH